MTPRVAMSTASDPLGMRLGRHSYAYEATATCAGVTTAAHVFCHTTAHIDYIQLYENIKNV